MKPFDLDAALRGEPVCTVSGDPVYELHLFKRIPKLIGVLLDGPTAWGVDGRLAAGIDGRLDLRMAPKKRQMWARAYRDSTGNITCWWWSGRCGELQWEKKNLPWVSDPVLVYEWEE